MKFAYTILYVANVPKTIEFYKNAFGFKEKFVTGENDYGELISGETTISFANFELANQNLKSGNSFQHSSLDQKAFGIELAFTTENIDEDFQQALNAGATLAESVIEKPWGQKVGYLRDINGFLIEVCTPIKMGK
ncbi:unnamed protein product [Dimorphilus gyrociliatus]|uniref:VOC domain-containing protein n=1 Tax=Dimorphilus gyrociliatus TaxID=2664684 RepID=A0A7I8VHB1_9ANNE|nr:unnamed protein product [Dimorphilus gyrociliatus]